MTAPPIRRLKLLENQTANGNGESFEWDGIGKGTLHIYGTFDTCTVSIEGSTDGGVTWTAYATTYTAAIIIPFQAGTILVRASVSSAGGSTDINCDIVSQERP